MKSAGQAHYLPMLVSQGDADGFLQEQLKPENLVAIADNKGYPLTFEMHAGYDQSYFFISSFIDQHLLFHHPFLTAQIHWCVGMTFLPLHTLLDF